MTTWFITGISSGLGRHIAEQVLEAGGRVAGTVRRPSAVEDLANRYPDGLTTHRLDVTDLAAVQRVVDASHELVGIAEQAPEGVGHLVEEVPLEHLAIAVSEVVLQTFLLRGELHGEASEREHAPLTA